MQKRRWAMMGILVLLAAISVLYHRYLAPRHEVLNVQGQTMGTYYSITAVQKPGLAELSHLQPRIEQTLLRVNKSLSTWDQESWISRFNADTENLSRQELDTDFATVMAVSEQVFQQSHGAFNPSLAPLISLWGFDRDPDDAWPTEQQVALAQANSNFASLRFVATPEPTLQRTQAGVQVNFSAIAKGYAVDELVRLLQGAGYSDLLVDIGGELRALGANDGVPWRVGIERPDQEGVVVQEVITLQDQAIATSGDYRNYRTKGGKRFSHILDPRTGYPIEHSVASVSVRASSAMVADAWATALLVNGLAGLKTCDELQLACLMIVREGKEYISRKNLYWSP